MNVTLFWGYLVPALLALAFKVALFAYAYKNRTSTGATRIYLYLLIAFTAQNLITIAAYPNLSAGKVPYFEADLFYVATTFAIALTVHLSALVALAPSGVLWRRFLAGLYLAAVVLTVLILNTSLVIRGYDMRDYVIASVRGPLHPLFSGYALLCLLGCIGVFVYGMRAGSTPQRKAKNQLMVFATVPMQASVILVLALSILGVNAINFSILSPILISYFLAVTAYVSHRHRLLDIQFYIPWSKVRQRKNAFYERVHSMSRELASLKSVKEVVRRLSETLGCPVALVGGNTLAAASAEGDGLTKFPLDMLKTIDSIVIANEIADHMPQTYELMHRHGVAAIVPFHPHSRAVASWMLLGESFGEQVYTPLDVKTIEQLFNRLGEHLLDELALARSQLQDTEQRLDEAMRELERLKQENLRLRAAAPNANAAEQTQDATQSVQTLDERVAEFEMRIIAETLARCGGNKSKAARALGLRPNTLHYKIERYGLGGKNPAR